MTLTSTAPLHAPSTAEAAQNKLPKRAALVSNLLVVLCSESDVQPVVRTDSGT